MYIHPTLPSAFQRYNMGRLSRNVKVDTLLKVFGHSKKMFRFRVEVCGWGEGFEGEHTDNGLRPTYFGLMGLQANVSF